MPQRTAQPRSGAPRPPYKRRKRATPAPVREAVLQRAICKWLDVAGIEFSVTDASLTFGSDGKPRKRVKPGWPDITGCCPLDGRFLAIEVKSEKGVLRPMQRVVLQRLKDMGAIVIVPRDVATVVRELDVWYGSIKGSNDQDLLRLQRAIRAYLDAIARDAAQKII